MDQAVSGLNYIISLDFVIFKKISIWLHQVFAATHGIFFVLQGLLSGCGPQASEHLSSVVLT